jgi:curved DNA-binding protein CbpA
MYRILGLNPTAGEKEIKESYRKLVKKYHPDLNKKTSNTEELEKIINAYESILRNKKRLIQFPIKSAAESYRRKGSGLEGKSIFALGDLAVNGNLPTIRAFAVKSLGFSGKKTAYAFIRKALYDKDRYVVKMAVDAVANLGIQQSVGELASLFSRGRADIKLAVLDAVEKMNMYDKFGSLIAEAMKNPNAVVRMKARRLYTKAAETNRKTGAGA